MLYQPLNLLVLKGGWGSECKCRYKVRRFRAQGGEVNVGSIVGVYMGSICACYRDPTPHSRLSPSKSMARIQKSFFSTK